MKHQMSEYTAAKIPGSFKMEGSDNIDNELDNIKAYFFKNV